MKFKRVLLKLSGETLAKEGGTGIDAAALASVVSEIRQARTPGLEIAIVIGAGNIWRGAGKSVDRVTADSMGMLATVMNSLALRDALITAGIPAGVLTAVEMSRVAETYTADRALGFLSDGGIAILAGGTGNPFFTTDTTAALRAAEIKADAVLKATQVDGVYSDDPKKNPKAVRYETLSFAEAIEKGLKIMDTAAFSLCRENDIPIIVFDFHKPGNLARVLTGEKIGTVVTGGR